MGFWQLGNTTVRSAIRIRDGLVALSTSPIQGNIRGREGDIAFRQLLGECGVVSLGQDNTNSVGRKWRASMGKLGFIYPEVDSSMGFTQRDLGQLDTITPAGWNLIRANTVAAIQECYLRAMVTPLERLDNDQTFSPLCWSLALLLEIERRGEDPSINFIEMASIVQTTNPINELTITVDRILDFRNLRNAAENKRSFDNSVYENGANEMGCRPQTFKDYADMNIRYLKTTGMVQAKGKGIAIVPEKRAMALKLVENMLFNKSLFDLYSSLCNGTSLPTDNNVAVARQVLDDLLNQIGQYGITYSIEGKHLDTPTDINRIRYEVETLIAEKKEEIYAREQSAQWREIATYMEMIASRCYYRSLPAESGISIPKTEAPAYLEWSLWRAFLAINSLVNRPYEVRRFKIDQDFLPISTAPGNGPDLVAEFEDFVVVIEVTLSESSRQEAMEGAPVRRHVADLMLRYQKPVYCIFVANRIDSNTAETFRIGGWYTDDDIRLNLHIVPFTLSQFCSFFKKIFSEHQATPQILVSLITECENCREMHSGPEWKAAITRIVENHI